MPAPRPQPALHPFEAAVGAFLRTESLLRDGDRVVVALSGGPDSAALLHALAALAAGPGPRIRIVAAHFDHRLRPGSEREAAAARSMARRLRVPFRGGRARSPLAPRGNSPERAAREARYAFLAAVARRERARAVAVGHHREDRAETVLHRLLQGGTLRGLAGIPLRRPLPGAPRCSVVRPLFDRDRASILGYLADRGIPFVEDPTNAGGANARARLRRSILPPLREAYPAAPGALLRLEALAREASDILDADLREAARGIRARGGTASLGRAAFEGRSEEGVRRLLTLLLARLPGPRRVPPLAAVARVRSALAAGDRRARIVPVAGSAKGEVVEAEVGPERVRVRVRRA